MNSKQLYLFEMPDPLEASEERWREFFEYHEFNPHIYEAFKEFAFQAIEEGRTKCGADSLIRDVRWKTETKVNHNFFPLYARHFIKEFPEHEGFFEFRQLKDSIKNYGETQH